MSELSPQQFRVAGMVAESATNKQIAAALGISERQIETHVTNIVERWRLDKGKNLRAQIVNEYRRRFGFPRLGA